MICLDCILKTEEKTLNQRLLWKKSSCTKDPERKCVRHFYCDHEHPLRWIETVWKLGGFKVI